jgi:hypothetical protein
MPTCLSTPNPCAQVCRLAVVHGCGREYQYAKRATELVQGHGDVVILVSIDSQT